MGQKFKHEDDTESDNENYDLTKEEEDIAYLLRYNSGYKEVDINKDDVAYTRGDKMVECLLNSTKYGVSSKQKLFKNRDDAINYCQQFMDKKLYVRVEKKVFRKKDTSDLAEGTKAPKKLKFFISSYKSFEPTSEVYYLWNYNPILFYKKVVGVIIMLGAVGLCLMPLWPAWLKVGCYYFGVGVSCFLGFFIGLYFFQQLILFSVLFVSLGRLRFIFLPNLIAECSFLESFVPLCTYEWRMKKVKKND
uniref:Translocation protein SEC62 n=1 Tax=Strongyloides venezuelensis TaxID=75913 RepID=A0A0K0FXK7_STRVS